MFIRRILKIRALPHLKAPGLLGAIQGGIYGKPKSYFSQYGTATADFGGNFQDSKSWATLNNWDSFVGYIAGLEKVPSHQVEPIYTCLVKHIQTQGVPTVRNALLDEGSKFSGNMGGLLDQMSKFHETTTHWAQILSVAGSLQIINDDLIKHMSVKIDEWIQDSVKLKHHSSAGSLLIVLANLYVHTKDVTYKSHLLNIIQRDRHFYNPNLKVIAVSALTLSFDNPDETQSNLLRDIIDSLVQSIQSCSIREYIEILHIETEAFVNSKGSQRRKPPLFTLEKKFYDLSGDVNTLEQVVQLVKCFGHLEHQSDKLWEI